MNFEGISDSNDIQRLEVDRVNSPEIRRAQKILRGNRADHCGGYFAVGAVLECAPLPS